MGGANRRDLADLQQQIADAQGAARASRTHDSAIGELASTTTHEFNNVLTTIINYAKLGIAPQGPGNARKVLR